MGDTSIDVTRLREQVVKRQVAFPLSPLLELLLIGDPRDQRCVWQRGPADSERWLRWKGKPRIPQEFVQKRSSLPKVMTRLAEGPA